MPREAFRFATDPLSHQEQYWGDNRHKDWFACFWEQGLGKTKATLDEALWLYAQGEIDALVVLAPNGVHRNWLAEEIPKHVHPSVKWKGCCYLTAKAKNKSFQREFQDVLDYKGLAILVISYDALMTDLGHKMTKAFLTKRSCFYAADESPRIKSPKAQRTKRVLASAPYAPYRRILSGTPVSNGPFDVYTQMKFLDRDFWKRAQFPNYSTFTACFGVFREINVPNVRAPVKIVERYRQLPLLNSLLAPHCSRLKKADVLDLPPKIFTKRYYSLNAAQQKLYRQIEQEGVFESSGGLHDASLAIVRGMRLYQVCCGYLPTDVEDTANSLELITEDNPRLNCLFDTFEDFPGKKLVWAKWTKDVDLIMERAAKQKIKAVRYDGQVDDDGRVAALHAITKGDAELFVAKQSVAGEGLTIVEAKTSLFYSNDWPLAPRLQAEDRNHRIGQDTRVTYVDIVAENTVDFPIVDSLQRKLNVASTILGDPVLEWIGDMEKGKAELIEGLPPGLLEFVTGDSGDLDGYLDFFRTNN